MTNYNTSKSQVIGNLTDTSNTSNTGRYPNIMNYTKGGYYHVHAPAKCYPTLADPIILTAVDDVTTWTHGTKVEIIPATTGITKPFDIHWVQISDISANAYYEINLYDGDDTVIGTVSFFKNNNFVVEGNCPIQIPIQPAGTQVKASVASSDDAGQTCKIKLYYHEYPDQ